MQLQGSVFLCKGLGTAARQTYDTALWYTVLWNTCYYTWSKAAKSKQSNYTKQSLHTRYCGNNFGLRLSRRQEPTLVSVSRWLSQSWALHHGVTRTVRFY